MDEPRKTYLLGDYRLEPDKQLLTRADRPIHLPKRPFQVLLYLIEHRDRYVSRAELLDTFWDGREVYDDALRKCVGAIRKALEDQSDKGHFVETRWGVGYRYVGPLEEQLVRAETAVVEIEKTRALHVVVEEEEIQDEAASVERTPPAPMSAAILPPPQRRTKVLALTLAACVVAVGAVVLFSLNLRPAKPEATSPPTRSVAVLPLKNLTGDPADEYLSDGITESLITALSRVEGLKVSSRGSVFTFKGRDVDPRAVGRLLGVASVLEGSVRRDGDRLRVEVRLVSTADGRVLWTSATFDRPVGDIFAVEDEVARNVAAHLAVQPDREQIAKRYTENVAAYEAYLKGRYFLNKRTPEGINRAIDYFRQAVIIDPNYALAYAGLGESYDKSLWFEGLPPQPVMAQERAAAARALALDESLPEAHVAMATVYANEWALTDAAREEERAIQLEPGCAEAHHNYAYRLIDLGRPAEAVAEIERARELDPLNIVMNVDAGEILLYARRYDEAITALQHARELDADRSSIHWNLAWAYQMKGQSAEAVAEFLQTLTLDGASPETLTALKDAYAAGGNKRFWQALLKQIQAQRGYAEPVRLAVVYAEMGDKDQAFAWLEKAYAEHSPRLVGLKHSFWYDDLRSDTRYTDLLRRTGLP